MRIYYPENVQRKIEQNLNNVFYEYRFNIPDMIEGCVGEHRFGISCGNCGGRSYCFDCFTQGDIKPPFPVGWEVGCGDE